MIIIKGTHANVYIDRGSIERVTSSDAKVRVHFKSGLVANYTDEKSMKSFMEQFLNPPTLQDTMRQIEEDYAERTAAPDEEDSNDEG